jgi:hypothetical protein
MKDEEKTWLIGNCRDRPAYLAVRRKSDWQSDLHLAVRHGKSQRTKNFVPFVFILLRK